MGECFACIHVSISHVSSVCGGQNWVLDPLELELQMVLNHHVGARNQTQVFCKSSSARNH